MKAQQGPDGTPYAARKKRKELKAKKGRIKHQKAAMFAKIRTTKYLKVHADPDQLIVGVVGKVMHIARVHHKGLTDSVSKNGPKYSYPARTLLGFSEADRTSIRDSFLRHLDYLED
ncbi:phage virion morphogenesis protein [Janthinobacterium sp. 1_2014MBL_MicDiv]|uniref:phage virion morphogenesis protein n=1 Tax=Janthinobacterium sp. 1_2014MBL_MicDiv TaxID=1644131 RepID=UPI001E354676|nr:phage virion morphogenesis protein [Janthinobacterium sp. 1_2014MBL_MicDiv]